MKRLLRMIDDFNEELSSSKRRVRFEVSKASVGDAYHVSLVSNFLSRFRRTLSSAKHSDEMRLIGFVEGAYHTLLGIREYRRSGRS